MKSLPSAAFSFYDQSTPIADLTASVENMEEEWRKKESLSDRIH
jgi:hypothetical protein